MYFPFDNSYARLPDRFYARLAPTPVSHPTLIKINHPLARHLGLDPEALATPEGIEILAGNRVPDGADPLAMAYAGHQFGGWVPQLGDGRAILLGELIDGDGNRRDIQLKGSGQTPFSRSGDGRAWVGPVLREYILSEAMAALGIPTTRALAAVLTGETIFREEVQPGAVLTRVASSHIRVGTFQFFAARQDNEGLRLLADHVIARHFPDALEAENPYAALLDQAVLQRMESDQGDDGPGRGLGFQGIQKPLDFPQFVIDLDADRLEELGGGMGFPSGGENFLGQVRQLLPTFDRALASMVHDRFGDPPCGSDLSIVAEDPLQLFGGVTVDHFVSVQGLFRIHPHIQWTGSRKTESALRLVQLCRRDPEIEHDSNHALCEIPCM